MEKSHFPSDYYKMHAAQNVSFVDSIMDGGGGDGGNGTGDFWSQQRRTSATTVSASNSHSFESGYDSAMTTSASTASTTNTSGDFFSTSSSYSTFSGHLEPINEDYEFGPPPQPFRQKVELTPTTRNIARINAFHITTPGTSSSKRAASTALQMVDVTPMKSRRLNTPSKQQSPKSITPFRHKLDENGDNDIENHVNLSQLLSPFDGSPRSSSSITAAVVPLAGKKSFVRHLSERSMQSSSTPINYDNLFRAKGQTVTKASNVENNVTAAAAANATSTDRIVPFAERHKMFRKTYSFSPSKHFQKKFANKSGEKSLVLDLPPISRGAGDNGPRNPARKLLQFNDDTFEQIVVPNTSINRKTETMELHEDDADAAAAVLSPISLYNNNNHEFSSNIFQTPPKNKVPISMELDSPVSTHEESSAAYQSPIFKTNNSTCSQWDLHLNADIVLDITPPASQHFATRSTPMKTQSSSTNNNHRSPSKEQKRIVYGAELPRTPPKSQRKQRRNEQQQQHGSVRLTAPAKRKLYSQTRKQRKSFEGYEKMDILGRLENTVPPLHNILKELSDKDLLSVICVSRRWRRLVESNALASQRIQLKRQTMSGTKENSLVVINFRPQHNQLQRSMSLRPNRIASSTKPFGNRMENIGGSMPESSSVVATAMESSELRQSPGTRAYLERQKVRIFSLHFLKEARSNM